MAQGTRNSGHRAGYGDGGGKAGPAPKAEEECEKPGLVSHPPDIPGWEELDFAQLGSLESSESSRAGGEEDSTEEITSQNGGERVPVASTGPGFSCPCDRNGLSLERLQRQRLLRKWSPQQRLQEGHPKAAGGGNETQLSHIPAWTIWALSSSEKRLRSGTGCLFQEKRPTCGSASQGAEPEEEEEEDEDKLLPRRWAR
ncbi:hypothetical protein Anapl_16342 [Anas platyrhynchos]|uniref:Uncharacterized protein n=1 Tax=Anas platyrhynchos TaxID=8839 RepID=R0KT25_ANAPL|nr:hypothetical protein Anapl_16342 [Anas platyrhynchos]